MSDDMDWLSELVTGSEDEAADESPPEAVPEVITFEPSPSEEELDLVDDLRSEMAADEEEQAAVENTPRPVRTFGGLRPWQLFFLSVLLFLDIVVIGLLVLVMLGRIVLPI